MVCAPSKDFCTAKITEAILNKIKVCGTFNIKFCIEIHLLKDDSRYHENKWHSLMRPPKIRSKMLIFVSSFWRFFQIGAQPVWNIGMKLLQKICTFLFQNDHLCILYRLLICQSCENVVYACKMNGINIS